MSARASMVDALDRLQDALEQLRALQGDDRIRVSPKASRAIAIAITNAETSLLWLEHVAKVVTS